MPSRAAANGRQGAGAIKPSALKPNSTLSHSASTPPTTTASAICRRNQRSATAKALALDEQAVDTVLLGPCSPVACCTNSVTACRLFSASLRTAAGKPPSAAGAA